MTPDEPSLADGLMVIFSPPSSEYIKTLILFAIPFTFARDSLLILSHSDLNWRDLSFAGSGVFRHGLFP